MEVPGTNVSMLKGRSKPWSGSVIVTSPLVRPRPVFSMAIWQTNPANTNGGVKSPLRRPPAALDPTSGGPSPTES
jgi:hypothetical protein